MSSPIGARLWGHVVNGVRFVAQRPSMYGAQSAIGHNILGHAKSLSSTTSSSFMADHLNLHGIDPLLQTAARVPPHLSGTGSSSTGGQIRIWDQNPLTSVQRARDHLSIFNPPRSRGESSQELQNAGVDSIQGGENLSFEMQIEQWKREAPEGENRSDAAKLILAYARREHSELFHQASSLEHSEEIMLDVGVLPSEEIDLIENVGVYSENSRFFLNLNGLNLSSLPHRFEELTSIEILSVAENRFTEMPDSVAKLPQLRELDLRNNCLTLVPSALKNAAELTHLFLAGNRIDQIAEWMLQSKLIFCDIFDLSKQRLFSKLFPKLLDWEDDAPTATEREEREKVSNKILDELDNPTRILLLRDHNLTSLPDIFDLLPNIDLLDVSMNRLETLPESITNLKKLKALYLQNNSFSTLPSALGALKQMELILCTFNPLKNLPRSLKGCSSLTIQLDSPDSREKSLIWDELSTNYNLAWDLKGITLRAFRAKWEPLKIWHSRGKFFTALKDWNDGPKEKIRQSIMCAHDFREKNLSLSLHDLEIFPWMIFDLENLEELHLFFDGNCYYFNMMLEIVCQSKIQKISLPSHAKPSPLFLEHFEESDRERYHWTRKKGSERNALGSKASTHQVAALSEAQTVQVPPSSGARAEGDPAFSKKDVHQASGPQTSYQQDRAMARLTRIIGPVEPAAVANGAGDDFSSADQSSLLSSLLTTGMLLYGMAKISGAKSVNIRETQAVESIQRLFRGHMGRNEAKRLKEEAKRVAEAQKNRKPPMMRSRL